MNLLATNEPKVLQVDQSWCSGPAWLVDMLMVCRGLRAWAAILELLRTWSIYSSRAPCGWAEYPSTLVWSDGGAAIRAMGEGREAYLSMPSVWSYFIYDGKWSGVP